MSAFCTRISACLFLAVVLPISLRAQSGFSGDGRVVTNVYTSLVDRANAVAVAPDGKVVVSGYGGSTYYDTIVLRYTSAGELDPTFGSGGIVSVSLSGRSDAAYAVAVQPDGKVVVAGYTTIGSSCTFCGGYRGNAFVARFTASGAYDTSFGTGGVATLDLAPSYGSYAYALVLQPDGKIVVAGSANSVAAVARLTASGAYDTTFDGDGKAFIDVPGGGEELYGLALQSDGKIVVAGISFGASSTYAGLVARLTAAGALDTGFGSAGIVRHDFGMGSNVQASAVAVQTSGRLVVYGNRGSSPYTSRVLGLTTSGAVDTGFGISGLVDVRASSNVSEGLGARLAGQSDDRLVVVSSDARSSFVRRYTASGHSDATFGRGGMARLTFPPRFYSGGDALAVQSDGKIAVAGGVYDGVSHSTAVARFRSDGRLDLSAIDAAGPGGVSSRLDTTRLRLWLDASEARRDVYNAVPYWPDRSASDGYAEQATADLQPEFYTTAAGGRPAVFFRSSLGPADWLATGSLPGLATDTLTWFVAYKANAINPGAQTVLSGGYTAGAGNASSAMWGTGLNGNAFEAFARSSGGTRVAVTRSGADTEWQLASGVWSADDSLAFRLDGGSVGKAGGATASPSGHTGVRLGSEDGLTGNYLGYIAEAIVFSGALSDGERAAVESYLGRKYGLVQQSGQDASIGDLTGVFVLGATGVTVNMTTNTATNLFLMGGREDAAPAVVPRPVTLNRTWTARLHNTPDGDFTYAITLDLTGLDLEGQAFTDLMVYKRPDGAVQWSRVTDLGGTLYFDEGNRTITVSGLTSFSEFAVGDNGGAALPVELAGFSATADGSDVVLRWTTASETDNAGFAIDVQSGAQGSWREAAFVSGHGTTAEGHVYTHRLTQLSPGRYAVRLRQMDLDGTATLSGAVEVVVGASSPLEVRTQGRRVVVAARQSAPLRVEVVNVLGQTVATLFEGIVEQGSARTFDVPEGLAPGVYVARAICGSAHAASARLVVMR